MSFFVELKRRNVFRVGIAYVLLGWAVLQGADFMLDLAEAPNWVIRVFAIAGVVGFPFALFFAWAFELTPEGIKRESEIDRSQPAPTQTGRKLNGIIIGLLVVIIALMAVERVWFAGRGSESAPGQSPESAAVSAPAKTIAVLPFADLSQAGDQAWFADGLAEEILNALVRVPDLQVAARTSSFAYKESNQDISEIAAELGVAHVLEGSVRSAGDRIRVTAQLIRASDGFHLWSQNYDRDVADMIGIQEDLARNIATALETSMDPEALAVMAQAGTDSVEAYQEYLRGLQLGDQSLNQPDSGENLFMESYRRFERAREIDPGFAEAHVRAANYWKVELTPSRTDTGTSGLQPLEMLREYNERIGLAIQNAKSEADRIRSRADRAMMELRLRDARRLFEGYLELRPNDELARFEYAGVLGMMSEFQAFREVLAYWKEKGKTDLTAANNYANEAYRVIDPSEAADFGLQAVERWPNSSSLIYQVHRTLMWAGRFREASEMAARYDALVPESDHLVRGREACAAGDREAAQQILDGLDGSLNNDLSVRWLLYNMLGNTRDEIEILRPLEGTGVPYQLASFLVYRKFDARPYPALMAVLEREGIQRPPPTIPPFRCPPPTQPSVAVLPFVAMSSGEDDGYFADGLTEEILNALAQLPELLVTARTSSFHFKGQDIPVQDIAAQLGVQHIVEGSVRRSGERARITAQLIRASDGFHLWSDTYDRTLDDVFGVQEDIAGNIAATLNVVLDEDKRQAMREAGIGDVEAFIAFQKGLEAFARAHRTSDPGEVLPEANRWFDAALAIVPDIQTALYLRTDLPGHLLYGHASGSTVEEPETLDAALAEIRNGLQAALRAAHNDAQRNILDVERTLFMDDWNGVTARLDRAFVPGDCTRLNWMPTLAAPYGWAEQVAQHSRDVVRCDPMSGLATAMQMMWELWSGHPERVVEIGDRFLDQTGEHPWIDDVRFLALLATGKYRDHPELLGPNPEGSFFIVPRTIYLHAMAGDLARARDVLDNWQATNEVDDLSMVVTAAALGDRALANEHAARMDARVGGNLALAEAVKACHCGAPFDLEATPNFKARIEEAGFDWPPPTRLQYPAKDW
ncbi:MAG: hypothetical protein HKP02_02675 [Xanthomonadales bacterium]|nr:hypothetical protein [Xanthomonadales bacterium]